MIGMERELGWLLICLRDWVIEGEGGREVGRVLGEWCSMLLVCSDLGAY